MAVGDCFQKRGNAEAEFAAGISDLTDFAEAFNAQGYSGRLSRAKGCARLRST